jgi:hypothetical protein
MPLILQGSSWRGNDAKFQTESLPVMTPGMHPQGLTQEGIDIGLFFQEFGDGLTQTMAGFAINPQQKRLAAGIGGLQGGGEFERMPRDDAVVALPGGDQGRRIGDARRYPVER